MIHQTVDFDLQNGNSNAICGLWNKWGGECVKSGKIDLCFYFDIHFTPIGEIEPY